ncbi:GWxTD domain-containing protein [Rubricoccus marinus]|uniref:GWxTD domain-containing protein n=1 Tax=Rubricoccus marinus TaxID=716817 RepID=A0A259TZ72_9BACT|nr:GWxTD domain-containing protein [Rubricoccus marinus]OZC03059.1 hypothetical protein BSZ36_08800 [Rubricoccus marinus]
MSVRFSSALAALLFLAAPLASAQSLPIQLDLDTASYLYGDGESILEIYVSVGVHTLTFVQEGDGYAAQVPVALSVLPAASGAPGGASRAPVFEQMLDLRFQVADTLLLQSGREYVEQVRTTLPPGEYDVVARVAPNAQAERAELELRANDVVVPNYEDTRSPSVSTVQLASSISRAEEGATNFVKSGLEVQPNPTGVFAMNAEGVGMRSVPYYAEIYGVDSSVSDENYTVLAYLSQSDRANPLDGYQQRSQRPVRPVDVIVGRFDISKLPTGAYYLRIAALNASNEPVAERSQKLYIVNPTVEQPNLYTSGQDFEMVLFAGMSQEEVDLELKQVSILANGREQSTARSLTDLDAKRNFLAAFWRDRDEDANPNINSARRTFLQRLNVARDRYSEPLVTEGEVSERGRVFVKYGPPTSVDSQPFGQDTVPYVVWRYENVPGNGQSVFVFADSYSSGRFELIHSDVTGEVSQPDWQEELTRMSIRN